MSKQIYVAGTSINPIKVSVGSVVAMRPVAKGEDYSFGITDSGRFARIEDKRINGIGVERHLINHGYVPATETDVFANKLLDKIAIYEAIEYVEQASKARAVALQVRYGGQRVRYVPFDSSKAIEPADVAVDDGSSVSLFRYASGLNCGRVQVKYSSSAMRTADMNLADGWVVGPESDIANFPRTTGIGGPIETAAFVIANSGIATVSRQNHLPDASNTKDVFADSRMSLSLTDSTDSIDIEISARGVLTVRYLRGDGEMVCERHGLEALLAHQVRLADAVGSIAAVIILARYKQAARTPGRLKKAA